MSAGKYMVSFVVEDRVLTWTRFYVDTLSAIDCKIQTYYTVLREYPTATIRAMVDV